MYLLKRSLLAFICVIALSTASGANTNQASLNSEDNNSKNYFLAAENPLSWYDANTACLKRNMTLVTIENESELQQLKSLLAECYQTGVCRFWTSGKAPYVFGLQPKGCNFTWNTSGQPIDEELWSDKEPNDCRYLDRCVAIKNLHSVEKLQVLDAYCFRKNAYLCEYQKTATVDTTPSGSKDFVLGMTSGPKSKTVPHKQYFIETQNWLSFHDASADCLRRNMTMLSIESECEQLHLEEALSKFKSWNWFWTSGRLLENTNEPEFKWFGSGRPVTYSNWAKDEPNNLKAKENCITMHNTHGVVLQNQNDWYDYKWFDGDCSGRNLYICEYF